MALLDQVKKSLTSGFQLPQFGQSESLKQLQAATAGREVVGGQGGPQQGSMAEMVAAAAAKQQQKEDVLQGQMAVEGLEQQEREQEQQFEQRLGALNEEELNMRQRAQNQAQQILQDFTQRRGELDFKENSARVQFAVASMRMSNDDYLDQLEVEGARARLDDQTAFEWELTNTIMSAEMELFKNDLSFKAAMNADDRAFKEYIAEIDINQALTLAAMQTEADETAAQYQAIGTAVSAGVKAVGTAAEKGYFDFDDTSSEETVDLPESVQLTDNAATLGSSPRTSSQNTTLQGVFIKPPDESYRGAAGDSLLPPGVISKEGSFDAGDLD